MKNIFSHHKKIISGIFVFLFIFPLLSFQEAKAQVTGVPVNETGANLLTNVKTTTESTISAIKNTFTAFNTDWDFVRTKFLNPAARLILRLVIKEMKRMALNYIITGQAGKPQFVTNFQLDAKQAAENAVRGYLSQLTGVNFCNFFPSPQQAVYSINLSLQLECSVTSGAYAQYLRDPASVTVIDRILAQDPSTDFIQTIISAGQQQAQAVAQASIARAAQTSSGFIGDFIKEVSQPSQEQIAASTAQQREAARQVALQDYDSTHEEINEAERQAIGNAAAAAVQIRAPEPTIIENIKTPGQAVSGLLNNTINTDFMEPTVAKEFDEAVIQIVDTAFQVMISKGLNNVFGH